MNRLLLAGFVLVLAPFEIVANTPKTQSARYFRPAGAKFEMECGFDVLHIKNRMHLESTTVRGKASLNVLAVYDHKNELIVAEVNLSDAKGSRSALIKVIKGKAKIQRTGQPAQEFDVPPGVIVTSAPDWTDAWTLCRRLDRKKKGKQEFAGLWIHPEQPAQRLTFAIERKGADTIDHAGKKLELDRCTIWLRGNSSYAVWADDKGRMIKLVPLPYKDKAMNWLVLEGFEKSAAGLTP